MVPLKKPTTRYTDPWSLGISRNVGVICCTASKGPGISLLVRGRLEKPSCEETGQDQRTKSERVKFWEPLSENLL